jgi:hypothetical protein
MLRSRKSTDEGAGPGKTYPALRSARYLQNLSKSRWLFWVQLPIGNYGDEVNYQPLLLPRTFNFYTSFDHQCKQITENYDT